MTDHRVDIVAFECCSRVLRKLLVKKNAHQPTESSERARELRRPGHVSPRGTGAETRPGSRRLRDSRTATVSEPACRRTQAYRQEFWDRNVRRRSETP